MRKKEVRKKKVGGGEAAMRTLGLGGVTTQSGSMGKEEGKGDDLETRRGSRNQWDAIIHARDLGT